MPTRTDRTAGELDWPAWADRSAPDAREGTAKYSVTLHKAIKRLGTELEDRVDADHWRLSTAAPHRKSDGLPYANASPDDPGAVVRWTVDGEDYCLACDRYTRLRDNVRTLGLYVQETRKRSERPVRSGRDEFAAARLPPGDGDGATNDVVVAGPAGGLSEEPHEILGVSPDAPDPVIHGAFRELAKEGHADQGDDDRFDVGELKRARDALLREVNGGA